MKHKSIDSYVQHVHEGITSAIIKYLFGQKLKPAVDELEKLVANEDPQLQADVKQWKSEMDEIQAQIEKFCMRYPKNAMCKGRKKGEPNFKWR